MTAAMKAVEEGSPLNRVTRDFGVPRSPLHSHISRKVVHGVKPGPKPYIDEAKEKELGSYLELIPS